MHAHQDPIAQAITHACTTLAALAEATATPHVLRATWSENGRATIVHLDDKDTATPLELDTQGPRSGHARMQVHAQARQANQAMDALGHTITAHPVLGPVAKHHPLVLCAGSPPWAQCSLRIGPFLPPSLTYTRSFCSDIVATLTRAAAATGPARRRTCTALGEGVYLPSFVRAPHGFMRAMDRSYQKFGSAKTTRVMRPATPRPTTPPAPDADLWARLRAAWDRLCTMPLPDIAAFPAPQEHRARPTCTLRLDTTHGIATTRLYVGSAHMGRYERLDARAQPCLHGQDAPIHAAAAAWDAFLDAATAIAPVLASQRPKSHSDWEAFAPHAFLLQDTRPKSPAARTVSLWGTARPDPLATIAALAGAPDSTHTWTDLQGTLLVPGHSAAVAATALECTGRVLLVEHDPS